MAGTLRLSNTGTGNGQSTITTAASGDTTYTLPSGGGTFVTTSSTQALTVPFASGTVSAPSVTFLGDTNTGIYSPAADTIAFTEGGVESLRIDSSGRVGVGTTTPTSDGTRTVHVYAGAGSNSLVRVTGNAGTGLDLISGGDGTAYLWNRDNTALLFGTNATERARIDSSGRLLVGTSSGGGVARLQVQGSTLFNDAFFDLCYNGSAASTIAANTVLGSIRFTDQASSANQFATIKCEADAAVSSASDLPGRLVFSTTKDGQASPTEALRIDSQQRLIAGYIPSGAGTVFLKWNGGTGLISYDSSSRLIKENIEDSDYGLNEVMRLKPRRYWRKDDQRQEVGFIADEVAAVMPEFAPVGTKSTITGNDDDTEQIPVSVNYDKLTAVLTKAMQEAIGEIESLKARVAALESA